MRLHWEQLFIQKYLLKNMQNNPYFFIPGGHPVIILQVSKLLKQTETPWFGHKWGYLDEILSRFNKNV